MRLRHPLPTVTGEPLRQAIKRETEYPPPAPTVTVPLSKAIEVMQRDRAHRAEVRAALQVGAFFGLVVGAAITAAVLGLGGGM